MSDALVPTLRTLKQKEFYAEPRFHASFAWALLHRSVPSHSPAGVEAPSSSSSTPTPLPHSPQSIDGQPEAGPNPLKPTGPDAFPTIARFPPTLVPSLNTAFGERLRARHVGTFEVGAVHVKIGKDVSKYRLSGATR